MIIEYLPEIITRTLKPPDLISEDSTYYDTGLFLIWSIVDTYKFVNSHSPRNQIPCHGS
jgi:hypothetical protein